MKILRNIYYRIYQTVFKVLSPMLPWRTPELLSGDGAVSKLPAFIKEKGIDKVLIVTDKMLMSIGLLDGLTEGLKNSGIEYFIYDKTVPNPTIDNIEEGLTMYKDNGCRAIIAFGGGSPMDCAKVIGARAVRPNKPVSKMRGLFKVLRRLPPLFAIPTTAGTGSEATLAAVISDSRTHEKYPINDFSLIPHYAVLDPALTLKLPKHITSTTGMDALTHAVEAYIGNSNTAYTIDMSEKAVKLIFDNIKKAYDDGSDIAARSDMQLAAYYAGIAFTRAYVGYVHAIAHTLGGLYGVPHGLANAVILPYVLEAFGGAAHKRLSKLADIAGIEGGSEAEKAGKFIAAIREYNAYMSIPEKIKGIKEEDFETIAKRALREANPLYPVPVIWGREEIKAILSKIKE